jgi:CRISP-associated protein Cas1
MPASGIHARSIMLSSSRLGLIAKLDLVEGEGDRVTPVDYKRGKRPHVPKAAYDPKRVQLCVQGMILEEHGYRCEAGMLYFADFPRARARRARRGIAGHDARGRQLSWARRRGGPDAAALQAW